jgi:putative heme-binding domain-containing protein
LETLRTGSADPNSLLVFDVAARLQELKPPDDPQEIATVLHVLRQHMHHPPRRYPFGNLHQLLVAWTGNRAIALSLAEKEPAAAYEQWVAWFASNYAEQAAKLGGSLEEENAALLARLESLDWSRGDIQRGQTAFEKFSCARCHLGRSRLGPDLNGVANRFSRRDLFLAIVDPSRDISPAYRTMQVETGSGQVVVGQIVYESPEATLVQTDADTTVRISGEEIRALGPSPLSPMPSGLLRAATDDELADLYAYLRTLEKK